MSIIKNIFEVPSYFMRQYENVFFTAAGVIVLAYFAFKYTVTPSQKLIYFVGFSVAVFFLPKLTKRFLGEVALTKDEALTLEKIKNSALSDVEKKKEMDRQFPKMTAWQMAAFVGVSLWMILELYMCTGLAVFLSQFPSVQELTALIPTDIFLKHGTQRSATDILYLKVFKLVQIMTTPFVLGLCFIIARPVICNKEWFPILPSFVFLDKTLTGWKKIRQIIWGGVATFVFVILFFGGLLFLIVGGYTNDGINKRHFLNPHLTIEMWYSICGFTIMGSLLISCLICIIQDWGLLLYKLIKGDHHE